MTADDRLRCWAAGVEVHQNLAAAMENAGQMITLLRAGHDSSTTFTTEAANYQLHIGAAREGIREAVACGDHDDQAGELSWVGEMRRFSDTIGRTPRTEADARHLYEQLDSVLDWMRRDTAGVPSPALRSVPYVVAFTDPAGETRIDSVWRSRDDADREVRRITERSGTGWGAHVLREGERVFLPGVSPEFVGGDAASDVTWALRALRLRQEG